MGEIARQKCRTSLLAGKAVRLKGWLAVTEEKPVT
jgi:hypothetical protein